jgi:hypothetical protein
MSGRGLLIVVGVLIASVLPGCGGGSHPAQPDPRAKLERWGVTANTICMRTIMRITGRGRPASASSVDDTIVAAAQDIDDAAASLARIPRPPGAHPKLDTFLREAERVRALMRKLAAGVRGGRFDTVVDAADDLSIELEVLSDYGSEAGVLTCGQPMRAADALEAIFATSLSRDVDAVDRRMGRRLKRITHGPRPATPAEASRYYAREADILYRWADQLSRVSDDDDEQLGPPVYLFRHAIMNAQTLCRRVSGELAGGPVTPARGSVLQRRFKAAVKQVNRRYAQLVAAIAQASRPLLPDPPDGGAPPGEPQVI